MFEGFGEREVMEYPQEVGEQILEILITAFFQVLVFDSRRQHLDQVQIFK